MTRTMYDAIDPRLIPLLPVPDLVAGYVAGRWPSYLGYTTTFGVRVPSIRERFPSTRPVSIAVQASQDAQVLDVEQFDATPAEAPGWAVRQRRRGQIPTVYVNTSTWPAVVAEFRRQGVPLPLWWAAQYDGVAQLVPGSIAKQYHNTLGWDRSIVADYWPGVDPPPARPAPAPVRHFSEDMMLLAKDPHSGGWWLLFANNTRRPVHDTTSLAGYRSAGVPEVKDPGLSSDELAAYADAGS